MTARNRGRKGHKSTSPIIGKKCHTGGDKEMKNVFRKKGGGKAKKIPKRIITPQGGDKEMKNVFHKKGGGEAEKIPKRIIIPQDCHYKAMMNKKYGITKKDVYW